MPVDTKRIAAAVKEILDATGEDADREGLADTPRRVAEMYVELFSGLGRDPSEVLGVGFEENHQEMVVLTDIPFYSMCEHHMLPFFGKAHIAYIPNGWITGLSKVAYVVECFARRLQVQERLTTEIAEAIQTILRRENYPNAYEVLKDFSRGKKINQKNIKQFIEKLNISASVKKELLSITPHNYTGL